MTAPVQPQSSTGLGHCLHIMLWFCEGHPYHASGRWCPSPLAAKAVKGDIMREALRGAARQQHVGLS